MDVGGIGDAHGRTPGARSYVYLDEAKKSTNALSLALTTKPCSARYWLVTPATSATFATGAECYRTTGEPDALILPSHASSGKPSIGVDKLPDSAQICSCFDVTKGMLVAAINKGCHTVAALKAETKAGTGCGGCIPLVTQVLNAELAKQGIEVTNTCVNTFAYSRQELYHLIRVEGIKSFDELLAKYGKGYGCEVCKPTVGSLLASCWKRIHSETAAHAAAGYQRQLPGKHPERRHLLRYPALCRWRNHPEGLMEVGRIAREFNLYTKITGSQRIGLFGAQKDDLPEIWRQLIEAGFETVTRMLKRCEWRKPAWAAPWCRYGVGDSVGFGVELENRYKGIRTSAQMKFWRFRLYP